MTHSINSLTFRSNLAEVNLTAFHSNVKMMKQSLEANCLLLAVIKTDAYGHGLVPIGEEAVKAGADRLGVTKVSEGIQLREAGIQVPIQLLSPIREEEIDHVIHYDFIPSVSSVSTAKQLNQVAIEQQKSISVHLKVNTGLNRFGIEPEDAVGFCNACFSLEGISWEGIYTHFSDADNGNWKETEQQFHTFREVIGILESSGYTFPIHHVGASTIALERPDMHLDMVRPGVALFGYPPAKRQESLLPLQPVLTLKTKIMMIREVKGNQYIGYGRNYRTTGKEKVGILPIGLRTGYLMALSNKGEVLVRGKRAKVIGSISLDHTFINLTHIPDVEVGDEVILLGLERDESITAKNIAEWTHGNVDEVLTNFMHRIHRSYTNDEQ